MRRAVPRRVTMRLFMTVDSVGGVWTYALDLARGLLAHRVTTTLAVCGPSPPRTESQAAATIPGLTLLDTGLPLDWLAASETEVAKSAASLASLAREANADVVQLNGPSLAAFGDFCVPVVGVCHSCLASWWRDVRGGPLPEDLRWRTQLLRRGHEACAALVAPSASFAAATRDIYGRMPAVIHNGRATARGQQDARGHFAMTAGRLWDDGKNVAMLDAAAALVDFPVLAAGPLSGPGGAAAVLRHIRPLGRLDSAKLRRWMSRAPVFVSLALYEPFGLAVLEAAQAGCALVLADIDTFRELWDGVAIFVPADVPQAAAAALQRLVEDPTEAALLGKAARLHAARYDLATTAASMHALYARVLVREAIVA